ncbi:MAG: PilZ domain-containing protein [Fuerstiella sp.]
MRPSIANRNVRRTKRASLHQRASLQPSFWTWPRFLEKGQSAPDLRLLQQAIPELTAELRMPNGHTVDAAICALSEHDLVLNIPSHSNVPARGQVVEVTVCCGERKVVTTQKCILHWAGIINGIPVVAGFVLDSLGDALQQWTCHDTQTDIRFPVVLPAVVAVDSDHDVMGQIVDYSLSGLRLVTEEPIELEKDFATTVRMQHSSVQLTIRPRWVLDTGEGHQIGCTMPSEQGVLLACRFHAQPTSQSPPLRPQTRNWNGAGERINGESRFGFESSID